MAGFDRLRAAVAMPGKCGPRMRREAQGRSAMQSVQRLRGAAVGAAFAAMISVACAAFADTEAPSWVPTGSLGTARTAHTATLLLDGRVLVVGGAGAPQPVTGPG